MKFPNYLKQNGTIGFVAPSFGCATEPYISGFKNAQKKFAEFGHSFVIGPNCYEASGVGISNLPVKCADEWMHAYESKESDVLISCGGGELMCEILEYIDFERIKNAEPKWFMGYSDNTNLTYLLTTACDVASIYGPCVAAFGMEPWHEAVKDAYDVLRGVAGKDDNEKSESLQVTNYDGYETESLKDEEHPTAPYHITEDFYMKAYVGHKLVEFSDKTDNMCFSGRLIGGCLDCLVTLSGTKFDHTKEFIEKYKEDGIIWCLEACELNVFSIRRAMWQLKQTGWFKYIKGFLIGRSLMAEPMMGLDSYQAYLEVAGEFQVPVLFDLDIGHKPPMMPLVLGSMATVTVGNNQIMIEMNTMETL